MIWIFCREKDVAGIDINMGCPKTFSVSVSLLRYVVSHLDLTKSLVAIVT